MGKATQIIWRWPSLFRIQDLGVCVNLSIVMFLLHPEYTSTFCSVCVLIFIMVVELNALNYIPSITVFDKRVLEGLSSIQI